MARSAKSPSAPPRSSAPGSSLKRKKICLIPTCGRPAKTRGLCARCYLTARTKVKSSDLTWEKLEQLGLAVPSVKGSQSKLFHTALERALQSQAPVINPQAAPDEFPLQDPPESKTEPTNKSSEPDPRTPDLPWKDQL